MVQCPKLRSWVKARGFALKLSGRRWTQRGATGIAILRCDRREQIWTRPHIQTPMPDLATSAR